MPLLDFTAKLYKAFDEHEQAIQLAKLTLRDPVWIALDKYYGDSITSLGIDSRGAIDLGIPWNQDLAASISTMLNDYGFKGEIELDTGPVIDTSLSNEYFKFTKGKIHENPMTIWVAVNPEDEKSTCKLVLKGTEEKVQIVNVYERECKE